MRCEPSPPGPRPARHEFRQMVDVARARMLQVSECGDVPDKRALDDAVQAMTLLLLSLTPDDDDD